jgi:hypothetical protein
MSDDIDVEAEIDKIERTLADQFNGGPIPERFVTGRPGTSRRYHTQVCYRVANNIRNTDTWKRGNTPQLKEATDRIITFHDLEWCDACSKMEAREKRESE